MFEKIKRWYTLGLWMQAQVEQALEKGIITQQQYQNIISR